jgi:hypothetical protein
VQRVAEVGIASTNPREPNARRPTRVDRSLRVRCTRPRPSGYFALLLYRPVAYVQSPPTEVRLQDGAQLAVQQPLDLRTDAAGTSLVRPITLLLRGRALVGQVKDPTLRLVLNSFPPLLGCDHVGEGRGRR